jgi:hypothetical protein
MNSISYLAKARRPWGLVASLGLVLLAHRSPAQAVQNNTGPYTNAGNSYHAAGFVNSGTVANTGVFATTNTFAAQGIAFTNTGSYAFVAGGANPVTDQFAGPGAQTLAGTVAPQFFNLTLANAGGTFTVANAAGLDVANVLQLTNGLTTTTGPTTPPTGAADVAGAIRLGTAATVAGATGTATYIDGYVGKAGSAAFTYPLGATPTGTVGGTNPSPTSSPLYSPITLSNPGGATLRYVAGASPTPNPIAFATQGGGLQLTNVSRKEFYPLFVPAGGGLNTNITLPYTNFGPASYVGDPTQLTVAGFDGTQWVNLSTTPTNATNGSTVTVTVPAGTDLSGYQALALASTSAANPLPVEFTSFMATKAQATGVLRWATASELHAAYFEVQASPNGQTWTALGQVAATGTSSTAHSYSFIDKNLARYGVATVYYRLRQTDTDGTSQFSPVRMLAPDALAWNVEAYPNPYTQVVRLQLNSAETGPVTITLVDALGRTLLQQQTTVTAGIQTINLDQAGQLPAGTYMLLIRQNNHRRTLRLVRQE